MSDAILSPADRSDAAALARATATRASAAAAALRTCAGAQRDRALDAIADAIERDAPAILEANAGDIAGLTERHDDGEHGAAFVQRLHLTPAKLDAMCRSVRAVRDLPDPCDRLVESRVLDDGLVLRRVSCPIGVLAVIFESRPDAVTQIASLAIKSGNAVILKGGVEAERTTRALVGAIRRALSASGLPADVVTSVAGRDATAALLTLDDLIDLVIPRGSGALVRMVRAASRIPVLGHAAGICHVYVDAAADPAMAVRIVTDSKVQYAAACNAAEAVLVHEEIAGRVVPVLVAALAAAGVEVRACARARALLAGAPLPAGAPAVHDATDDDWGREYSDLVIALRVVPSLEAAMAHIARYGSRHTDAIVTDDADAAERFLAGVDSAGVFHNVSTRFADGYRYGLGAEVGIATGKIHARGPVGIEGLVTYRYELRGAGHVVADYTGPDRRRFRHEAVPSETVHAAGAVTPCARACASDDAAPMTRADGARS